MGEQPTKRAFAVGDKVTWTKRTETARGGLSFSERCGTITELHPSMASVKMRNGQTTKLFYERLTPADQKNEVTRIFEAIAGTVGGIRKEGDGA